MIRFISNSLLVFLLSWTSVSAQRSLKDIPNPDPAEQIKTFSLAEGFEVNLYASDPVIAKPVQMNWDAQGRLWVVSSGTYPHIKPGQTAGDQLVMLEDRDGDGIAEHHQVFAEGLLVPTAVMPGDGGVYVANSTELLHFKDTNGDGKADQRRVVLSGFGTEDTHHILHTLRWGPGGDLYFNQSIYIHSHIETPHGPKRLLAGGVWRFRPETMELEVFNRGLINSWGTQFNRWGQWFQTDGAGSDGINYVFPGTVMRTAKGYSRIVRGLNPGQPKQCGLEAVSGTHFPDAWQERLITCDFRGNRINSFRLKPANSAYVSVKEEDLISSTSIAFRPIDVRMGPDGAMYVADWYNPIIQHGEVDFRDDRRDHTHGRIWRITAKNRPLSEKPTVADASIASLLELLKSPSAWTRDQARLAFKQHSSGAVLVAVNKWVANLDAADPEVNHHKLEALWVCQQVREVNDKLLREACSSEDYRLRAAGVRVLSDWLNDVSEGYSLLQQLVDDPHPQVRLEAVNALRLSDNPLAVQAAVRVLQYDMDDHLDFALWRLLRDLEDDWLPHVQANPSFLGTDLQALIVAIQTSENPAAVKPLMSLLDDENLSMEDRQVVVKLLGELGAPEALRKLFDRVWENPKETSLLLGALHVAASKRKAKPSGDLNNIAELLGRDGDVGPQAIRLVGLWGLTGLKDKLVALAVGADTPSGLRTAALEGIAGFGRSEIPTIMSVIDSVDDPSLQDQAIATLFRIAPIRAADKAIDLLALPQDTQRVNSLIRLFLSTKQGPKLLATQLAGKQIVKENAGAGIQEIARSGRNEKGLISALEKSGGLAAVKQAMSPAELKAFLAEVASQGRPAQGEAIYRRQSLLCMNCHAIAGSGGQVGPDLTSIGASAPMDYIVESLLEPMKKIKEGYHVTMLTQKGGAVAAGVLIRESDTTAYLRDGADHQIEVTKAHITKREIVPTSLMPAALTASLRRDEMVDLVAFLSQLGKPGAFNVSSRAYVRTWQGLTGDAGQVDEVRHAGVAKPASNDPSLRWVPAYSGVNGEFPMYPNQTRFHNIGGLHYFFVRFAVEAKQEGNIRLDFNEANGLQVWLGTNEVKNFNDVDIKVKRGQHWVTVAIQEQARGGKALQVELKEAEQQDASAVLIGGK